MSESFDWHSFLESVEALCRQVEHRIQLSDSNTLQDFLFRLQAKRTACERLIGAAVASGVDTSVSENVQGNVKRLSNVIQHLIDDVERDSYNQLTLPFIALQYFRKLSYIVMVRLGDLSLSLT